MSDPLTLEHGHDGRAAHLTLNRPEQSNALNRALLDRLDAAVEELAASADLRVVTLRGAGGTFCAGADLRELGGYVEAGDRDGAAEYLARIHGSLDALAALPVPVVAVVEGYALAGGLETVLACDLVLASTEATLGDQHANYGLVAGGGGTQRLPRVVGVRRAKELMFTGRHLDAAEAVEWGLANRAVAPDALDGAVEDLVDELASKSPNAAGLTKDLVDLSADVSLETGLDLERERVGRYLFSDDVREGLDAFTEGRDPEF